MKANTDEVDRLVDCLLDEMLGKQEPVDLTGRVLARAFPVSPEKSVQPWKKPRRVAFFAYGAAAAAVVVAATLWIVQQGYPSPSAEGAYAIENGGPLKRGAVVTTIDQSATLKLGGYCSIRLAPDTRVRLEGLDRAERVALLKGEVRCSVDRNAGAFDVWTSIGLVSVRGTEFIVNLQSKAGTTAEASNYLLGVTVLSGTVNVSHDGKDVILSPGPMHVFGSETEFTPPLVPHVVSSDPPAHRLSGADDGEAHALSKGVVEGVVKSKGPNWIEVMSVSGKVDTYVPEWEGGMGGGPNRQTLAGIARLKVGEQVRIRWYVDNKVRIKELEALGNGAPGR